MTDFRQPPEGALDAGPFELIDSIVQGLVQGLALPQLEAQALMFAQTRLAHLPELAEDRRMVLALVRALATNLPLPARHWRPQPMARPERNARCYCGSGQKYKHCCAEYEHMLLPLEPDMLLALAIFHAPPQYLQPSSLCRLSPMALSQVAGLWMEQNEPQRVVDTLLPLFEQPELLDENHEVALDFLLDAMLQLGLNTQRLELMRALAQGPVLALATTARSRHVSHLADQGNYAAAWTLFGQAQREAPDDPQLLHLELITLLTEGRDEEARLRAPLLAARARRMGHEELAEVLTELGRQGLDALNDWPSDDPALMWLQSEVLPHWQAVLARLPAQLDTAQLQALYQRTLSGPDEQKHIHLQPVHALQLMNRRWQKRFKVHKPQGPAQLGGDAGALLDDAAALLPFFVKNPQAWYSLEVLVDLLMALDHVLELNAVQTPWRALGQALLDHAEAVLRLLMAPADSADAAAATGQVLDWYDPDCQPAARLLGQLIQGRLGLDQSAELLLEWSLAVMPYDPLGWRHVLVDEQINQQRWDQAWRCLERYPNDMAPSDHRQALVHYALGRHEEARRVLERAHADAPAFMLALWPDALDPPPVDENSPGMAVGGAEHAFEYRLTARRAWIDSGALDWSRTLGLPTQVPVVAHKNHAQRPSGPQPRRPSTVPSAPMPGASAQLMGGENWPAQRQKLRKSHDWPRLHGFLTAVAWAPEVVQPGTWLPVALQMRSKAWPKTQAAHDRAVDGDLNALVAMFNSLMDGLNQRVGQSPLPSDQVLNVPRALNPRGADQVSDEELQRWAAGFVHACELSATLWKNAGHPVRPGQRGKNKRSPSLAQLYDLAASAPPLPETEVGGPAWQASTEEGQPLLRALDLEDTRSESVRERLQQALRPLWDSVLPVHQARLRGSGGSMRE